MLQAYVLATQNPLCVMTTQNPVVNHGGCISHCGSCVKCASKACRRKHVAGVRADNPKILRVDNSESSVRADNPEPSLRAERPEPFGKPWRLHKPLEISRQMYTNAYPICCLFASLPHINMQPWQVGTALLSSSTHAQLMTHQPR
jgi:hypothetical protein